jgi:hypothetical protein
MRRTLVAFLLPIAVVMLLADAAGATVTYYTPFALASPNRCGVGVGQANRTDATHVLIQVETRSYTAGSDGVCNDPAPYAHHGVRVLARLEKLFSTGWGECRVGSEIELPQGYDSVSSLSIVPWCGSGTYRVAADHSIFYSTWNSARLHSEIFTK